MEVEMAQRNQDAKVRTSDVGRINRFRLCYTTVALWV